MQSVLYIALDVLVHLWAPILCHTCEEVNDIMQFDAESVHLGKFADQIRALIEKYGAEEKETIE